VLLIPRAVLGELQRVSDSSDPQRRTRGRRGLDNLSALQRDPSVEVVLVEDEAMGDVDAGLVRLARDRGGAVVTADANLVKVAHALSVPVRSIHALAAAFRVPFLPGESLNVRLTRQGRDHGQAIGYLEDGTMVVVEQATELIGSEVSVRVTNVLQTSTGRMMFASREPPELGVATTDEPGRRPSSRPVGNDTSSRGGNARGDPSGDSARPTTRDRLRAGLKGPEDRANTDATRDEAEDAAGEADAGPSHHAPATRGSRPS
jgi:rRNA-processing protein FCF1